MSTSHQPNQPISLVKTKIVEIDGQAADVPVEVILRLLPSPAVVIYSKQLPSIVVAEKPFSMSLANGAHFKAACGSLNFGTREGFLIPVQQPVAVIDKCLPLESVRFGILNLPTIYGRQDKWAEDKRRIPYTRLEVPGWIVEISGVPNIDDVERILRQDKGYGVTYNGVITGSGLNGFLAKDVEGLLEALRCFLSFARGASCTLVMVEGIDQAGEVSWIRWGVHNVESWGNNHSWFRQLDGAETLSILFSKFWPLFASEAQDTLLRAIDWYLQSNVSFPYIGIILSVAVLELLSGHILGRAKKERTGEFVNEALKELEIPSDLPGYCEALQDIKTWKHGPHAIVEVRNDLVHPKKNKELAKISNDAIHEAWNLGQWSVEMILLRMLEYQGFYVNRLAGWHEADRIIQRVPWER